MSERDERELREPPDVPDWSREQASDVLLAVGLLRVLVARLGTPRHEQGDE